MLRQTKRMRYLVAAVALAVLALTGCRGRKNVDVEATEGPRAHRFDLAQLTEALSSPDPDVRFAAVIDLGQRGADAAPAVPALTRALSDNNLNVRSSAADA